MTKNPKKKVDFFRMLKIFFLSFEGTFPKCFRYLSRKKRRRREIKVK